MLSWQVFPTADSVMPDWSSRLISELDTADRRAESVAKGLNPVQLNWQPRQGAWSVGQCLEHLRIANEVYLPAIAAALEGRQRRPVDDIRLGWFSRWFIRSYIAPNRKGTRARAPKKIEPTKQVEPSVLEAFLRSNQSARELVRRAMDHDVNRIRFKNPFSPLLRFTVGTGVEIIAKHQSRHLLQAEGVRQSAGFPL
jgi:DinB superfamily